MQTCENGYETCRYLTSLSSRPLLLFFLPSSKTLWLMCLYVTTLLAMFKSSHLEMHQLFNYYKPFFGVHGFFINIIIFFSNLNKKLSPLIKCELTTTFKTAESSGRLLWSGVSQSRIILHLVWYFVPTVATNLKRFFKRIHCNRHVLSRGKVDVIGVLLPIDLDDVPIHMQDLT